jgi:hypothetical protein
MKKILTTKEIKKANVSLSLRPWASKVEAEYFNFNGSVGYVEGYKEGFVVRVGYSRAFQIINILTTPFLFPIDVLLMGVPEAIKTYKNGFRTGYIVSEAYGPNDPQFDALKEIFGIE